jgi:hypothetical protein
MAGRLLKTLFVMQLLFFGSYSQDGFSKTVETEAELVRLQGDISRLMQRNAWKGVERTYQAMVALNTTLRAEDHMAGEQAARMRGDITTAYTRLASAVGDRTTINSESPAEIKDAFIRLENIELRYGRVSIEVHDGRVPALVRFDWPFAREERVAIELGREVLGRDRVFQGFLPIGKYMVDGLFFEVAPGVEGQDIQVIPHEK